MLQALPVALGWHWAGEGYMDKVQIANSSSFVGNVYIVERWPPYFEINM